MIRTLLLVGVAAAAMSMVRMCRSEIARERARREAWHKDHETTRWEGEGGNPVEPSFRGASAT